MNRTLDIRKEGKLNAVSLSRVYQTEFQGEGGRETAGGAPLYGSEIIDSRGRKKNAQRSLGGCRGGSTGREREGGGGEANWRESPGYKASCGKRSRV